MCIKWRKQIKKTPPNKPCLLWDPSKLLNPRYFSCAVQCMWFSLWWEATHFIELIALSFNYTHLLSNYKYVYHSWRTMHVKPVCSQWRVNQSDNNTNILKWKLIIGSILWHSLSSWFSLLVHIVVLLHSLLRAIPVPRAMAALENAWLRMTWSSLWILT